jgi:hypothetical protein
VVLLFAGTASADELAPLTDEQKRIMFGSAEDVLVDDKPTHFVHTNECMHQVWKPYVKNIGGAYLGVGTDQNLTLVAWARAEVAFLIDYDPRVVGVNHAHRALLEHSPDIATYVARFDAANRSETETILDTEYASHPERRAIVAAFRRYRGRIARYYARILRRRATRNHFLHDEDDYRYVHRLAAADRIRVMKGDLLAAASVRGIGRITNEIAIPMRVVYMSNAEEFWSYSTVFRDNYAGMSMDDKTVILRTRHTDVYGPRLDDFVYVVEDGVDFRSKLQQRNARGRWKHSGIWSLLGDRAATTDVGVFTIGPVERLDPTPTPPAIPVKRCPQ